MIESSAKIGLKMLKMVNSPGELVLRREILKLSIVRRNGPRLLLVAQHCGYDTNLVP